MKMIKKTFVLLAVMFLFIGDYLLVKMTNSPPIFSIRSSDSLNHTYTTPFYRVWKCYSGLTHVGLFTDSFNCPQVINDFIIINETKECADALELFYSDDYYNYYFPCIQSSTIFIKFIDDNKIPVKEALANNLVTIDQLKKAGLFFYQNARFEIEAKSASKCKTTKLISINDNNLFTYCLNDINVNIDYIHYALKDALTSNKISIEKIINKLEYDKEKKEFYNNGNTIIYRNSNYALLNCGNKNYYIGPEDMEYNNNFCN